VLNLKSNSECPHYNITEEREEPALDNDSQETLTDAETADDALEDAAMAAYREAHFKRQRFRILLGIVLVVALAYALK